jgi:hypothetical protein
MTRRRWGKAGQPLTAQEAAKIGQRHYARGLTDHRAHRQWQAGELVPYRITVALDMQRLEGPEVDEACGAREPDVDMWEAGTKYPTWEQLQLLAKLTGCTERFFMLPASGHLPLETSMRFHRIGGQKVAWRQPPPVRAFTPEAIAATVRSQP